MVVKMLQTLELPNFGLVLQFFLVTDELSSHDDLEFLHQLYWCVVAVVALFLWSLSGRCVSLPTEFL